ncbi:hypothetical protein ACQKIE_04740 [Luteibacter sp. NPDC031894]|uniref:hypothetical protein n=1 Tax=Luteibacter sp. NPDC031894 TaxID=3390572 RepID=UPI003CFCFB3B
MAAQQHKIVFYPVGNGDTTHIILANGRRILLDFRHCSDAEKGERPEIDLKKRLKDELDAAERDSLDVVAFTHADADHIQGSTEFFELRHAKKYHGDGRIKINELWVPAAMLLEVADRDHQQEEFVLWRQEARHRLLEGEGIRVFSQPQVLMDWLEPLLEQRGEPAEARDHLFVDAGTVVPGFSLDDDAVEFFCHSPFIEHCEGGDQIRNEAALVFNIRFVAGGERFDYLEVGDANWEAMKEIVDITDFHGNNDRLEWDLFNIPHHLSYTALGPDKGDKETKPEESVEKLLRMGKPDAYIVSCSKACPDVKKAYDQIQPPHIQARHTYERYLEEVGGRKFLVTGEEPNANKPQPIEFEITADGLSWNRVATVAAAQVLSSKPPRAGS